MIAVESKGIEIDPNLVEREVQSLGAMCESLAAIVKAQLLKQLELKLRAFSPSKEVLSMYPFFGNINKLLSDYESCLEVIPNSEGVSLIMNRQGLSERNLPENLLDLLEFGNSKLPPFAHVRVVLPTLSPLISQALKEV